MSGNALGVGTKSIPSVHTVRSRDEKEKEDREDRIDLYKIEGLSLLRLGTVRMYLLVSGRRRWYLSRQRSSSLKVGALEGEGVIPVIIVLVTPVVGGGGDHSSCEVGVVIGEFNFKIGF